MENESENAQPKIGIVVGILGLLACLAMDAASLIPGVGDVEEFPAGLVFVVQMVLKMPSSVLLAQGVAMILKAIPVIQELPLWTIAWIIAWIVSNLPGKLGKVAVQAIETAAEAKGGGTGAISGEVEGVAGEVSSGVQGMERGAGAEGLAGGPRGLESGEGMPNTGRPAQEEGMTADAGGQPSGEEASSALDEVGGNPMENLQQDLLERKEEPKEPQAATPYQGDAPSTNNTDNVIPFRAPRNPQQENDQEKAA